jgi:hypothetical protein
VTYAFVVDPDDEETLAVIQRRPADIIEWPNGRSADQRDWGPDRYEQMVELRNRLLGRVRQLAPSWFLSLDSDILLHPQTLTNLLESTERFDAVGGRTYMTPGDTTCPSWGTVTHSGGLRRSDAEGVFPIQVIMAIKLMSPAAYDVDYEYHAHGEDLGWAAACRRRGLRLGVDARVANKHVMSPAMLERTDPRCGF